MRLRAMDLLIVEGLEKPTRLDLVLSSQTESISRSEAKRIIETGNIVVNGSKERFTPKKPVQNGDEISYERMLAPVPGEKLVAVPHKLDIIFEDESLLVVNKPRGMVVHPAWGHWEDTLVNYLLHHSTLSEKDPLRPGIVHRLDKDTSGLLVVAKKTDVHDKLAEQFAQRSVERLYTAIAWGVPSMNRGTVDQPLGRDRKDRKKRAIREDGKHAVTHWKVIRKYRFLTLLECKLETGRTHQIRVHMSSLGHPLLGDALYGSFRNYGMKLPRQLQDRLKNWNGQALHAGLLGFQHPVTEKWIEFYKEPPKTMQKIIAALEAESNH